MIVTILSLKIINMILSIFAFATTVSHSSFSEFSVQCHNDSTPVTQQLHFGYPFRLSSSAAFMVPLCPSSAALGTSSPSSPGTFSPSELPSPPRSPEPHVLTAPCCDYVHGARFYVTVGVVSFIYCMLATGMYVVFDDMCRREENIPTMDFVLSMVFSVLWLIASGTWSDNVVHMKQFVDPRELFVHRVPECGSSSPLDCQVTRLPNYSALHMSLLFGFMSVIVHAASALSLQTEAKWFRTDAEHECLSPSLSQLESQEGSLKSFDDDEDEDEEEDGVETENAQQKQQQQPILPAEKQG